MYNENSIVTLSQGEAFRQKIGMYLSANRQEAINLGLRELIVNVQDEYEQYKPTNPKVIIKLNTQERTISVQDNMRGIPVGTREDGINSLTAAFLLSHSGGKHEEGAYSSAIGCNGIGNKTVCHTAKWLKVIVHRDGKKYTQEFTSTEKGATPSYEVKEEKSNTTQTGTYIEYKPDELVYGDIFIDVESLENMLQEMAYFTKGLKIVLIVDEKEKIFLSNNGLIDSLNSKDAISKKISYCSETEDCKVEIALQFVTKDGEIKAFANGLHVKDGGAFMVGFKRALTTTTNSLSKQSFTGENIRKCLSGIVSVKVKSPQFSNQMKTELANPEARKPTSTAISTALKEWKKNDEVDFEKVIGLLLKIDKAEKAADKARTSILAGNSEISKERKKKAVMPAVLIDCQEHNENSVLYIVEGESAAGNLINARNPKNQAIFRLKGKILNVLKASEETALNSEVLNGLDKALGCGLGSSFNMKNLRYGRIVLLTDEDYDGYSIRCLLCTYFNNRYPDIFKSGKISVGRTPLYAKYIGQKKYYAFTEEDAVNLPKGGELLRKKGLGALTEEDIVKTIFSATPYEERIIFKDEDEYKEYCDLLEVFMGKNIEPRREYIEKINF